MRIAIMTIAGFTVLLVAFLWRATEPSVAPPFPDNQGGIWPISLIQQRIAAVQSNAVQRRDSNVATLSAEEERTTKIDTVKKNLNVPLMATVSPWRLTPKFFKERNNNRAIFRVLKQLRHATPVEATKFEDETIQFVEEKDLKKTLFYETLPLLLNDGLITFFYYKLKEAPQIVNESGTPDYVALYDDKILPDRMMLSKNPEDCFLRQTSAFCSPEPAGGDEQLLICDFDYLKKYELKPDVRTTTPGYGGRAVVLNGRIVEISGVRSDDEGFPLIKAAFLSSFAVHVVVVRHATMAHLAIGQRLLVKLTAGRTQAYQDAWNRSKGPSLLLTATTYRTNLVSINEQLLAGPGNSLFGCALSLTNDGLVELEMDMYEKYSDMTPDALVAEIGGSGTPTWTNACNIAWQGAKDVVNVICKDIQPFWRIPTCRTLRSSFGRRRSTMDLLATFSSTMLSRATSSYHSR